MGEALIFSQNDSMKHTLNWMTCWFMWENMSLDSLWYVCVSHLLLGLAVLPLTRLLLDVCCHGEGGTVMAVSQVDDVSDRRQHGSLAAGADDGVSFTHRQKQLKKHIHRHQWVQNAKQKISVSKWHMMGMIRQEASRSFIESCSITQQHILFLMLDKRFLKPTQRSAAVLRLPLCTVWSRSGCPWLPSSENSRCRATSHRHGASWSRQTPQRTWLWSVVECTEAPRGMLAPASKWCHFQKGSRLWIMWWTKTFDGDCLQALTHFTSMIHESRIQAFCGW